MQDSSNSLSGTLSSRAHSQEVPPALGASASRVSADAAPAPRPLIRRGCDFVLTATLTAALACMTPAAAFASDADVAADWASAAAQLDDGSYEPYSFATSDGAASLAATSDDGTVEPLKAKYDLRDPNGDGDRSDSVVTSVKFQNPWGTCWAFSTIAASEASILSEEGKTAAETGMDLSELQLADAIYKSDGAPASVVGDAQAGEGFHTDSDDANIGLDLGGFALYGSSIFASGIGPVGESQVPYKNSDGLIQCVVAYRDSGTTLNLDLTEDQITAYELKGCAVLKLNYTGNYVNKDGEWTNADWSMDSSLWNASALNLENGNILPNAITRDAKGQYVSTNEDAITAVKGEIQYYGRGVVVYYNASYAVSGNGTEGALYNRVSQIPNHAVTIVGWDDDYDVSNFSSDASEQPPAKGAWLIKNSWGSETESFPNYNPSGVVEDGKSTGYFWLSYYDKSLEGLESFDFDINSYSDNDEYYIDQYDYMPEQTAITLPSDTPVSTANIFTAAGDMSLRTLGAATYKPNTTVTYQVYLLDDEATSPTDAQHSKLVYSFDDTYQYGGYHRATLPESDWIAMRKGQRYAVVTTQKCNDDGKWYQGVAVNLKSFASADSDDSRKYYKSSLTKTYNDFYFNQYYEEYIAKGMADKEAAEAAASAAETKLESAEVVKTINDQVEQHFADYHETGFVAKVNAGESWTGKTKAQAATADSESGSVGASAETEWSDWTVVKESIEKEGPDYAVDNASVKAFSEVRSFASVSELDSLASVLSAAKDVLDAAAVSADGADVYACDTWMTQAEHDAAAAAVASAEKLLDAAGDYHDSLANTTPSSDEVAAAAAALAFEAHAGGKAVPTFPDVDYSEGSWYADSVGWCAAHGLFAGYPDGTFGVGRSMGRAELATVLWRHFEPEEAAGYDAAAAKADGAVDGVEDGAFYTAAANWAVGAGVIQGFEVEGQDKRDFAPYGELSFEQLVSVVAKASGADYESSDLSVLDGFADKDSVSDWAAHAMAWAVEEGLVSGWDNGAERQRELKPAETVARERAAVVLANAFAAGVLR